ncbi:Hypothetical protein SMAX5B_005424 [Scophthalmus maximus]|uniref:Uncharacterized protein n=1 Tax=Scophthalmus maximus TaxID=52904 RepID=A0A2U9B1Y3_SCOMX|nr:Hypothetical protein SMAX5B_005424 [Scophthalmus maximus]
MTAEQWNLLKSGKPDDTTKMQLADLLLKLISSLLTDVLKALKRARRPVSLDSVRSRLGDSLRQSFAPGSSRQSESLDRLTDLIVEEVTETVNSDLSSACTSSASYEEPELSHFTKPNKLEKMIRCTCRVLKTFSAKILFKPQPPRQRGQTTRPQTHGTEVQVIQWKTTLSDSVSSTDISEGSTTSEVSSEGSSQKSTIFQEIIDKEVTELIEPLLDGVSDSDYSMLQSEISLEIKVAADEIAPLIFDEYIANLFSADPSPKLHRQWFRGVGKKVTNLCAKTFATATILKTLRHVQKKFQKETKVQDGPAIRSLMAGIDSLLLKGEKQKGANDSYASLRFEKLSRAKVLELTWVFADLLYMHATAARNPVMTPDTVTKVSVPRSDRDMYEDIKRTALYFLSLMSWWVNNQVACFTDRVTQALMNSESLSTPDASKLNVMKTPKEQAEQRKMLVNVLVDDLVTNIYQKLKVECTGCNTARIAHHLFEETWAKVKDIDVVFHPRIFRNFDKAVFEDLCNRWCCPESLLVSISLGEPEVAQCIASYIRSHLSNQTSANPSLVSSVRKGLGKCGRNVLDVMKYTYDMYLYYYTFRRI